MNKTEINIDISNANQRVDRFLRKFFKNTPDISLGDIYAAIRKGDIKIHGKKAKEEYRLQEGDTLLIKMKKNTGGAKKQKKEIKLGNFCKAILYEDDNWLIMNKPPHLVVHPNSPEQIGLQDFIETYCEKDITDTFTPSLGHRLDKDTSGVIIAAKNYPALQYFNKLIRSREVSKYYLAIVVGAFPKHLLIDKALEKQFNKKFNRGQTVVNERYGEKAISECWNEQTIEHPDLGTLSLIKIKIETGKMHQIRVHTAHEGFPVLGDIVYGKAVVNRILYKQLGVKRQLLHAHQYRFFDMFSSKNIDVTAPLPDDFKIVLDPKIDTY